MPFLADVADQKRKDTQMKTFLKNEWLQLLILIAPFIAVALLWNQIPDRVPSHWNARGQINGYSGKAVGTLLMPCINIFVALLIAGLPRIDPKLAKRDPESRANTLHTVRIMRLAITTFESLFALAIIFIAAKVFPHDLDFNSIVYIGLGGLLIVMGNFMTKLRPNYFVGIRTPWTLESKEVWIKTHRVGGPLMIVMGLVIAVSGLFIPTRFIVFVVLASVLGYTAFIFFYSYSVHKKQQAMPTQSVS